MLVGANGGVFAIRRELFTALPDFAIIDDFPDRHADSQPWI